MNHDPVANFQLFFPWPTFGRFIDIELCLPETPHKSCRFGNDLTQLYNHHNWQTSSNLYAGVIQAELFIYVFLENAVKTISYSLNSAEIHISQGP